MRRVVRASRVREDLRRPVAKSREQGAQFFDQALVRALIVGAKRQHRPTSGSECHAVLCSWQILGHREPIGRARHPHLVRPERDVPHLDELVAPSVADDLGHQRVRPALRLNLAERIGRARPAQIEVVDRQCLLELVAIHSPPDALQHRRQMRHIACADHARRIGKPVRMAIAGGSQ
jgi:hypothetical protein